MKHLPPLVARFLLLWLVLPAEGLASQSPEFSFSGDSSGDNFGYAVAGGVDIDADGYADLIVGSQWDTGVAGNSGSVQVFSGRDGARLFVIFGDFLAHRLGAAVSGLKDITQDGYDEFAVGAPNSAGPPNESNVRVYSGVDGALLYDFSYAAGNAGFGESVDAVGDVNGDGFEDLAYSARDEGSPPPGPLDTGFVEVRSGFDGSSLFLFKGTAGSVFAPEAVGGGGDINQDGTPDILVGLPLGSQDTGSAVVYSGADGSVLYSRVGRNFGDRFGVSVDIVGDVNGDGYPEWIVGAEQAQPWSHIPLDAGYIQVFSGRDGSMIHEIHGDGIGDYFGHSVSAAGDINNDGSADFVVGAPQIDSIGGKGYVRVHSGRDGTTLFQLRGREAGNWYGHSVAEAGDVTGDGISDFILGAPSCNLVAPNAGCAYVYEGAAMVLTGSPGLAGQLNQLVIVDGTPGETVYFGYGTGPGSVPVPGCSGVSVRVANPVLLGSAVVNVLGQTGLPVDVPATASGLTVYVQALELGTCSVSNLLVHTFP